MKKELLRMEYLDVSHKGNLILEDFSMEVFKGEILGVLTKSNREIDSLIDVMAGVKIPLRGRISYQGYPLQSPYTGSKTHLNVISRKSQLIDDFKIADNIFVIRKGFKKFYINRKKLERQTSLMLEKLKIGISPGSYIKELCNLDKLVIEIAKSHILRVPIIVLKSLSGFLSDDEISRLYSYINILRESGQTFIIMDSTFNLIQKFSTRIVLLHKGRNMWTFNKGEFSEEIINKIFRIDSNERDLTFLPGNPEEKVLVIKNLVSPGLKSFSCSLCKGQIRVVIDPEGSQIDELWRILIGDNLEFSGSIESGGRTLKKINPHILLRENIGLISEDPVNSLLYPQFIGLDNLSFPMGQKVPFFWQKYQYRENIRQHYESFFSEGALYKKLRDLTTADLLTLIYLRWHLYSPDFIILIKPFSSVGRQQEDLTIKLMNQLVAKGIGLIILTSNLWELSALSRKLPLKIQRLHPIT